MDDFIEGSLSEDSNGLDNTNYEVEAALYSLVHHSEDAYNTNMLTISGNYVSERNKANRWETIHRITDSVKPGNYIQSYQNVNQAFNYIPLGDSSFANTSTVMYSTPYNKRGQHLKYPWNYRRNEKPWYAPNDMRNNSPKNRNLVPVYIEQKRLDCVDDQELLKINTFSSFEDPRSDFHNIQDRKSSDKAPLKYVECTFEQASSSNNQSDSKQSKSTTDTRNNPFYSRNVVQSALKNREKNKSIPIVDVECTTQSAGGKSNNFPEENTKNMQNFTSHRAENKTSNTVIDTSKESITNDVIILSDSDTSIVEVSVPPKPQPPLVALDSSDETESFIVSEAKLILNTSGNKPVDLLSEVPSTSQGTPERNKSSKNSLYSVSSTSKEIKKKNKRKKKKQNLTKSPECASWTAGMIQFYNQSWGGEMYDHVTLQKEMTNNPINWKILEVDKYGPIKDYGPLARVRCLNCHQFGHLAKHCPDPRKIICCSMCGERGHFERQCPNKICFKCGRGAPVFNEGCPSCWSNDHPRRCTTCGGEDHFIWSCPDAWRKFHSITTSEELQNGFLEETQFKLSNDLACCLCAGRGHIAETCSSLSKQNQSASSSPSIDFFATMKVFNRRKKKRRSYFEGNDNQHEFNKKRRKTR